MRFDNELILIAQTIESDDLANQIPKETKRKVYCEWKSAGSKEFYSAAVAGMKPERIFKVYGFEYDGEQKVEFQGKKYSVIRTYQKNLREMELVCERIGADVN